MADVTSVYQQQDGTSFKNPSSVCGVSDTHFVNAYPGTSNYGNVRVGVWNGVDDITFYTPVVFSSFTLSRIRLRKLTENKFIICYNTPWIMAFIEDEFTRH